MSRLINKVANSVSSTTSSIIGRDNVTKFTNSINKGLFLKSKYRDFLRAGNTVQIISRCSHMSLHICVSQNDSTRLILLGNGHVGPEALNSHFLIEQDPKNTHLKLKNGNNYISFDNDVPCILSDPPNPNNRQEKIRARNEFRLVEILGSEEYFCLESVYYPGRYLAVLPDGSITSTKNRADEKAQFCLNIIHIMPTQAQLRASSAASQTSVLYNAPVVAVSQEFVPQTRPYSLNTEATSSISSKDQEAAAFSSTNSFSNSAAASASTSDETPPNYSNLYPSLPKFDN